MKKPVRYLVFFLVVAVVGYWIFSNAVSKNKSIGASTTSRTVTAQVTRGDIDVSASGSSSIESGIKKNISSIMSGTVESIFVEEGQVVNEGDLLVTFEDGSKSSEIDRLKLELKKELDSLGDIRENADKLKIYAPLSGYLGDITVGVGDNVSNGFKLTSIIDNDHIFIMGYYNKNDSSNIKIGDKVDIAMDKYLTTVEGTVVKINQTPQIRDNGVVLYEVTVQADNPGAVAAGEAGRVLVKKNGAELRSYEDSSFTYSNTGDINILTGGKITRLNVSSGDRVEKGQLILELDSSDLNRQIEFQQNTVDMKNSEISEKLRALDDSAVYAPISGTVTTVNIAVGEQIGSNSTLLVIADLNNLEVTIPVDELDINKIEVGQDALITAEAVSGKIYDGIVSKIGLEGVYQNGVSTFDVTLQIKDSKGLRPGMTIEGKILIQQKKGTLLLPIEAIQTRQNESFVLLAGSGEDSEGIMTSIKIGLVSDNFVEIIDGLSEGDTVLYRGTSTNSEKQSFPGGIRIQGGNQGGNMPTGFGGGGARAIKPSNGGGN